MPKLKKLPFPQSLVVLIDTLEDVYDEHVKTLAKLANETRMTHKERSDVRKAFRRRMARQLAERKRMEAQRRWFYHPDNHSY